MPIVSHTWEETPQPSGQRSYVLRMQAQDGQVKQRAGFLNADMNKDTFIQSAIADADQQLADEEFVQIINGG